MALLLLIWCISLRPAPTFAQSNEPGLVVIHVAPQAQESQMALSLFFTVVDPNGRPLPQPNLESATVALLGEEGVGQAPVPAVVTAPQTPIYIALLLDASGSMASAMAAMHEAAKAAIDQAPPNVAFAVIPFNDLAVDEELRPLSGFTTDHDLIKRDIDIVEAKQGGATCLYNATYKAMELLDAQIRSPDQRRAIILFTDGRDEVVNSQPCSKRTYDDVIARATNDHSKRTPIFTIGLEEGNARINRNELISMAKETNAYYAIGDRNSLGDLFRVIMEGLNSQLVAFANILPHQGPNDAFLRVKLSGSATTLNVPFSFLSPVDYAQAEAPIAIRINDVSAFDETNNRYILSLAVDNPAGFQEVVVKVVDHETNTGMYELRRAAEATLAVNLDATTFKPAHDYRIEVYALDANGNLIPKPVREGDKPELMQDARVIKHIPPPPPAPVAVTVQGASADFATQKLMINLALSEVERVDKYAGFVRDQAGSQVLTFGPDVFLMPAPGQTPQVSVPLSPVMLKAVTEQEYTLVVQVWSKRDELASESEPYKFIVVPPPPLSFFERLRLILGNRWLQLTILVIVLCVTGWLVLRGTRKKKDEPAEPLPIDYTTPAVNIHGVAVQDSAQLKVQLVRAPNQNGNLKKVITHFPCRIGRHEECEINLAAVTTDKRIHDGTWKLPKPMAPFLSPIWVRKMEPMSAIRGWNRANRCVFRMQPWCV
ncbi:MAG: VWA domain-containing protein [Caldilineaceae bacterium]